MRHNLATLRQVIEGGTKTMIMRELRALEQKWEKRYEEENDWDKHSWGLKFLHQEKAKVIKEFLEG